MELTMHTETHIFLYASSAQRLVGTQTEGTHTNFGDSSGNGTIESQNRYLATKPGYDALSRFEFNGLIAIHNTDFGIGRAIAPLIGRASSLTAVE